VVWTPESIAELLTEQLRQAALLRQQLATERRPKERLLAWWRRLWIDPIRNFFAIVTAINFILALILLGVSWPPGGGQEMSALAVAQGSSLIFVVLLMSLLAGPLAASRELPTGPAWLTKDWRFWTGFALVGALSLAELWLGWARADRKEELATIALTTSGLGLTALLARELLHLSDPRALVLRQVKDALVRLEEAARAGRAKSTSALAASGVDPTVVQQVVQYADPVTREVATAHIREFLAAAKAACQRTDASLAATAHAAATVIVLQYLEGSESLSTQDELSGSTPRRATTFMRWQEVGPFERCRRSSLTTSDRLRRASPRRARRSQRMAGTRLR